MSQGTSKIASKPSEATRESSNRFSLHTLRGSQLCQHLDLRPVASRAMRQDISPFYSTESVVLCYSSPKELIQASFSPVQFSDF